MMRTKSRKDLNQAAIVKELREKGYDVDVVERPYDIVVSGEFEYLTGDLDHYQEVKVCSLRVELKSEKGKLSDSQKKYIENLQHPESYTVATSPADDPMPAVREIEKWFGR